MSDGVGRAVAGGGFGAGLVSPGMPRLSRWRPSRSRQVSLLSRAEPPGHELRVDRFGLRATFDRGAAATSDGTATVGSDYTGKSGTLTFAASETEKTVATPVLDYANEEL